MTGIANVFIDTNVLIYARDDRDAEKRERAALWLSALGRAAAGRLNLQVVMEFTRWMLANERHRPLSDLRAEAELLMTWGANAIGSDEVDTAWTIREVTGYQWFDCLLLSAATHLGCQYFLSEDMAAGARLGSLTIISPFRSSPSDILSTH